MTVYIDFQQYTISIILSRYCVIGCWQITYGSVIKLMHERTKFRLHSHDVPYGSGSGQQSVTGFPNVDDSNSYWVRIDVVYFPVFHIN